MAIPCCDRQITFSVVYPPYLSEWDCLLRRASGRPNAPPIFASKICAFIAVPSFAIC